MRSTILCIAALLLTSCGLAMSNEDRLDRAERAFQQKEFRAAIIDAKDVLRDEPGNLRGRLILGRASVAVGDGAAAEKEFRRAIQLGVSADEIAAPLARALLQQGKFQTIVDEIKLRDSTSSPEIVELKLIRGDAFMGLAQPDVARELYEDVVAATPDNVGAHLGIAMSYRAEGNISSARGALDHAIKAFADEINVWLASGDLRMSVQNYSTAKSDYVVAVDLASNVSNTAAEVQALSRPLSRSSRWKTLTARGNQRPESMNWHQTLYRRFS